MYALHRRKYYDKHQGGHYSMEFNEIVARKKEILSRPVHPIPADKLEVERKLYYERNKRSLKSSRKPEHYSRRSQHNLSQNKPFLWP